MKSKEGLNLLQYWRNTLADAARVVIEVEKTLHQRQVQLDLTRGLVEPKQALSLVLALEKRMNEDKGRLKQDDPALAILEEIPVFIAPFRVSPVPEFTQLTGETGVFYPFWIRAVLNKDGRLKPDEDTFPYIPRAYLEPQVNQEINYTFSDVDRVDQAFGHPFNGEPIWVHYLQYIRVTFKAIIGQSLDAYAPENFAITPEYTIVVNDALRGAADGIIGLYDYIIQQEDLPATLNTLAEHRETPLKPVLSAGAFEKASAAHLGQMAFEFPLSKSQRISLYHYTTLGHGNILAINGPPGTGKTTFLQSVVATEVVRSAIAGDKPAVILACSANNQAVTNIIDSFSNIKQKAGQLYERWLPKLAGFGLYLPGANREVPSHIPVIKRVSSKLSGAHTDKENETYLNSAEAYYITRSGQPGLDVSAIVKSLQKTLKNQLKTLTDGIDLWQEYRQLAARLPELDQYSIAELEKELKALELSFSNYLDAESIWLKIFSFLNFVKEKRATRAKQLFRDCPVNYDTIDFYLVKSIQQFFDEKLKLIQQIKKAQKDWLAWQKKAGLDTDPSQTAFYEQLEKGLKYDMFYTAVHYWEGRWLMATRSAVEEERLSRNGEGAAKERWERFAMLTPCFVSTFYMAPKFFSYSKFIHSDAGKNIYETPPLLDFIDLLIVDEAGQVSPEIGAATFALAQKALVVGDILQIEPVWNVPKKVDQANLHRYNVIKSLNDQVAIETLYAKGFLCSSGSIMRLAQKASPYHLHPKQARGMLLTEHRRCFDEIISYCNNLAYNGLLEPMKGPAKNTLLPPLQYIPTTGQSKVSGTSRANLDEALAIVQWLLVNQQALQVHYQLPLKDIVAIVTPFTGQKFTLRTALRQANISLNGLTIGTVHALQGAERPVILFSSTYGSNNIEKSYFFDAGVNMLNVAVSRAKDSFILFGCEEIFRRKGNAPSMLLYNYIKTIAKL
ncbi:MAG: hypothetical protein JWR05_3003 [Mucilaginibacter sp.]|nr:hypothetical protein [Mucilaginibacter sp.]